MFFKDQLLISPNELTVAYSTGTLMVFPGGTITVIDCELFVFWGALSTIKYLLVDVLEFRIVVGDK